MFICQPPEGVDGQIIIPQSVLDQVPDMGIIQNGRLSHYMEKLTANDGEDRRFDLFTIYC